MLKTLTLLSSLLLSSFLICSYYIGTFGSMFISCVNIFMVFIASVLSFWYLNHNLVSWLNTGNLAKSMFNKPHIVLYKWLGRLKFKPSLVFAVIFGCFFAFYVTINPCYAAARATVSLLDQVPNKVWIADGVTEILAAATGHSLELIDYVKPQFVYVASSPVIIPSPIVLHYFSNSVEQKMDPTCAGQVVGSMKAIGKLLKYSYSPQTMWKYSDRGLKWYREHGAFMYSKIHSLKKS